MVYSSYGMVATDLKSLDVEVIGNNLGPFPQREREWLGAPFLQVEPSMAFQYGLPLLLIKEKGVSDRGFWQPGYAPFIILEWDSELPLSAFFGSNEWKDVLKNWAYEVRSGYYKQTRPTFKY
jgi:hypothetical protein